MRLLLDEHYGRAVAERLRASGHDVVAVDERDDLRGLDDSHLLERAGEERRAVVTENARDFLAEHERRLRAGRTHYGIVLTSPKRLPRGKRYVGRLIAALDRFLRERPGENELAGLIYWI